MTRLREVLDGWLARCEGVPARPVTFAALRFLLLDLRRVLVR